MITEALAALGNSARDLFRNWRGLLLLALVYAGLLVSLYFFFATGVANVWQLAVSALMARDRGGPALCFQLLDIPEVDDRLSTPSMKQFTDTPLWHHPNAILSWEAYLGPGHNGDTSPYAVMW